VVLVVGLWLTRFLLGRLGEGILGWWAQALVVVSYLAMADFGLNSLLPRDVAAAVGRAGGWAAATELPGLIARYARFAAWQLPLAAVLAAGFSTLLARNGQFPLWPTVGLMAVAVVAFPLRVGSALLTGLQDVRFAGLVPLVVYLSGVAVTVGSVHTGAGVTGLVLGWSTQTLLAAGLVWTRVLTRYRAVLPSARQVLVARIPTKMLADGGWVWFSTVGVALAGTAEILVVGWFYPPEVVFRYSCTTRLVVALSPVALILCQAVLPGMVELRATGDPDRMRRATLAYTQLLLGVSGLFAVVLLAANRGFVGWWVGEDKYLGDAVTAAGVIGMTAWHGLNA
jgi:O-antigen/teichoic acid export membrane protein